MNNEIESVCVESMKRIVAIHGEEPELVNISEEAILDAFEIISDRPIRVRRVNSGKIKYLLFNIYNLRPEFRSDFESAVFDMWYEAYREVAGDRIIVEKTEEPDEGGQVDLEDSEKVSEAAPIKTDSVKVWQEPVEDIGAEPPESSESSEKTEETENVTAEENLMPAGFVPETVPTDTKEEKIADEPLGEAAGEVRETARKTSRPEPVNLRETSASGFKIRKEDLFDKFLNVVSGFMKKFCRCD